MNFGTTRISGWLVYGTAVAALLLTLVPLPDLLAVIRPPLLVMTVLYWSTLAPRTGGIFIGFAFGLALDIIQGEQLGQHALALSFVTYLAVRLHLLARAKPLFEQSLFALIALLLYECVLWAIDGWSGHPLNSILRWLPAFSGAALWPVVAGLLGRTHSPR